MSEIYGATTEEVRERVGSLSQVLRVEQFIETEGAGRGNRRIRLANGSGIEMELLPDRALDIGQVTVRGMPLAWISPVGSTGPDQYEATGNGWLRTFGGGFLATCGLDTFGPPSVDDGVMLGQHGRIGAQRARIVRADATPAGIVVEGLVRQAAVFGEDLVLRRTISFPAGSDTFVIDDVVTNQSFRATPHMILYHLNVGWPLLDEGAIVEIPSTSIVPRDAAAEAGIDRPLEIGGPTPDYAEQVFIHHLPEVEDVRLSISNPRIGVKFELSFSPSELPFAYEWKMTGQGHYVLGLEPANSQGIFGRERARADGQLPTLGPGESVHYRLSISLSDLDHANG